MISKRPRPYLASEAGDQDTSEHTSAVGAIKVINMYGGESTGKVRGIYPGSKALYYDGRSRIIKCREIFKSQLLQPTDESFPRRELIRTSSSINLSTSISPTLPSTSNHTAFQLRASIFSFHSCTQQTQ